MYQFCFTSRIINTRVLNVSFRKLSTVSVGKVAEKNSINGNNADLESLSTIVTKNRVKQPQREPFVKNLFLGKLDTEILAYPELNKNDVDQLEDIISLLQKFSNHQDDPKDFKEALCKLKMRRCLGLQCSLDIGGRELNQSEKCRFNEILLNSSYRYNILNNELGIDLLSKFGTDEQKTKYLEKLINGEISSTMSIAHNSIGSDEITSDIARAHITESFDSYVLKGKKKYVINGDTADIFIIFMKTGGTDRKFLEGNEFSAFIIDKSMPGVILEKIDVNNANLKGTCNIIFKDVLIPKENILGADGMGVDLLSKVLPEYHLNMSIINLNIMKKLVNSLSQDLLNNSAPGEEVYQTEAVTSIVSEILSYVYMVESMIYLTSGLMSTYENQDCEIESLITSIFSTELAVKSTVLGMSLVGTPFINSGHFCQKLHEEAIIQYTSYENENMTKLLIGLLGIQYSGKNLGETVKKLRNPMMFGNFILKRLWHFRKQSSDNPKLTLELKNYLHPSCQESANEIEYCVLRLQYATESLLGQYGIEVLNCHNHLRRLSESVMHIYAMISSLSRASRSYCIGLENSDAEMILANVVCRNSHKHVRSTLNDAIEQCLIMDDPLKHLSNNLYSKKSYYFAHPLSRIF